MRLYRRYGSRLAARRESRSKQVSAQLLFENEFEATNGAKAEYKAAAAKLRDLESPPKASPPKASPPKGITAGKVWPEGADE